MRTRAVCRAGRPWPWCTTLLWARPVYVPSLRCGGCRGDSHWCPQTDCVVARHCLGQNIAGPSFGRRFWLTHDNIIVWPRARADQFISFANPNGDVVVARPRASTRAHLPRSLVLTQAVAPTHPDDDIVWHHRTWQPCIRERGSSYILLCSHSVSLPRIRTCSVARALAATLAVTRHCPTPGGRWGSTLWIPRRPCTSTWTARWRLAWAQP